MKDSALYPILKKLSDQNYVEIYDQQFQGRNRKYYRITSDGETHRAELQNEWKLYCREIEAILQPEEKNQTGTIIEGGTEND